MIRTQFLCVFITVMPVLADRCDLPADKAEFVQRLPTDPIDRRNAIREALKDAPGDFTLNRLLLDRSVYQKAPVRAKYRAVFEAAPANLEAKYLYARSLIGSNTPEAQRLYAEILAKDPEYPWVHLSQLEVYRAEAFRDRKKLQASFVTVRRVCPSLSKPWEYLTELEDGALVAQEALRLREHLSGSKDPTALKMYQTLWAAEFRARPAEQHEALRQSVVEDLARLAALESFPEVRSAMTRGAQLANNQALAKQIEAQRPRSVMEQYTEWLKSDPRPKPEDPEEKREAYARKQLEKSATWIKMAPADPVGYAQRLYALVTLKADAAQLGRAGQDLLNVERRRELGALSFYLTVARAYLERGVFLDQVPTILQEALTSFDDPEAVIEIDLAPPPPGFSARNRMMNVSYHADAVVLLSELHEKRGEFDNAREALRSLEQYLIDKAPPNQDSEAAMLYRLAQFSFWFRTATLADHEGRKLDALHAYREARTASAVKREAILTAERRLWKELGGSDESWTRRLNAKSAPMADSASRQADDFKAVARAVPDFSLKDLQGRTWTPLQWKGKTVVAVVWATWCAPCLHELPHFEKLAARLKDRPDVLVMSLNTDDNTGVVEPFMKKNGYTVPVLLAKHFAEDLMPYFAIPRTWIFRDGVLVSESIGFGPDPETWANNILAQLK